MKGLEDPDKQEWRAERVLLLVLVSLFLFLILASYPTIWRLLCDKEKEGRGVKIDHVFNATSVNFALTKPKVPRVFFYDIILRMYHFFSMEILARMGNYSLHYSS